MSRSPRAAGCLDVPLAGRLGRAAGWILIAVAVGIAGLVRARLPWVPLAYLAALIALPVACYKLARWRRGPRALRWPALGVTTVALLALCPVPTMAAELDEPPSTAWRLDGWLLVGADVIDPPGRWYWLTVGRPPVVAEVVHGWLTERGSAQRSMVAVDPSHRPRVNESTAVAVGLRHAGVPVELAVTVEASACTLEGMPHRLVVARVNGVTVATRDGWARALASLAASNELVSADGEAFAFQGTRLPCGRVVVLDLPVEGLDAAVGGQLARLPPGRWYRGLALGGSHGAMVALVTYAHASGHDLAQGRSIAGTGGIAGDGSVGPVGGLPAKAAAARDVGADVLLFPAVQSHELDGFDAGTMQLLPVSSLAEAIAVLSPGPARAGRPLGAQAPMDRDTGASAARLGTAN